jgi:hypothetical protein
MPLGITQSDGVRLAAKLTFPVPWHAGVGQRLEGGHATVAALRLSFGSVIGGGCTMFDRGNCQDARLYIGDGPTED